MKLTDVAKRSVCLVLALLMAAGPVLAQQSRSSATSDYLQGKLDGERDAKGNPAWFLAGAACGIFGAGAAYFIKPEPPASALVGKSAQYVLGYREGYQNKSSGKNLGYACAGWAALVIVYVVILASQSDTE